MKFSFIGTFFGSDISVVSVSRTNVLFRSVEVTEEAAPPREEAIINPITMILFEGKLTC